MTIINAKDKKLSEINGDLPNVYNSLLNWYQKMTLKRIEKKVIDAKEVEIETSFNSLGLIEPMKPQEISMKPYGQRAWKWNNLFTTTADFRVEDVIDFRGTRFRVLNKIDFSIYGYFKYELVEDYDASVS